MNNLRERLVDAINMFQDNNADFNAEKLADYLMDEIEELSSNIVDSDFTINEIKSLIKHVMSKNNIRDLCILYFVLVYGMKRGDLQDLKWRQFIIEKNGEKMLHNYSTYSTKIPIPGFLLNALNELEKYYKENNIKTEYVFCATKSSEERKDKGKLRIAEQTINRIFNDWGYISENSERYTPSYIRKKLPMLLMLHGCNLEEILVYFNIQFTSINSFVSESDLEILFYNNIKRISINDFWEDVIKDCQ